MEVTVKNKYLALKFPYNEILVQLAKTIPGRRFNPSDKSWMFLPTYENIQYVKRHFPDAVWSTDTEQFIVSSEKRKKARDEVSEKREASEQLDLSELDMVPFRLPPYDHQKRALLIGRDAEVFAYFMDQGTGKTKVILDDAAHNFRKGKIRGLLVICPNTVKGVWVGDNYPIRDHGEEHKSDNADEVTRHMAPDIAYTKCAYSSTMNREVKYNYGKAKAKWKEADFLHIMVVNVEGLISSRMIDEIREFYAATDDKVMIVIDESTRIKNRTSKRAKMAKKIRARSKIARIATGTPVIKKPLDAYSQMDFLDPDILGCPNYYTFQARYAVMGGWNNKQVIQYVNLNDLADKLRGVSYRVKKEDCLDLPEKVYAKVSVEMSPKQEKAYKEMQVSSLTVLDNGEVVAAPVILTQLLRLQQITSGYLPLSYDEQGNIDQYDFDDKTPKMLAVMDLLDEADGKVIIWSRFRPEMDMMYNHLIKAGYKVKQFNGDVPTDERRKIINEFQNGDLQIFLGQIQTGGIGITLTAASYVIYLSNSFSTEDRVQSEDRAHRIGQKNHVTYYDVIVNKTVDEKIISTLRSNKEISDVVMRDGWKKWI